MAEAALDAGAHIVNDIMGLRADPALARARRRARGPRRADEQPARPDPARPAGGCDAPAFRQLDIALDAGIAWERIILDPGFGFGLHGEENLRVLARLGELRAWGGRCWSGTSRKSHIGLVLGTPVDDRVEGTAADGDAGIAQGADIVRVHDVRQMARVARMTDAVVRGWRGYQQAEERQS